MVKALVLEEKLKLNLRDIDVPEALGPRDVRIEMKTVGCAGATCTIIPMGESGSSSCGSR